MATLSKRAAALSNFYTKFANLSPREIRMSSFWNIMEEVEHGMLFVVRIDGEYVISASGQHPIRSRDTLDFISGGQRPQPIRWGIR